MARALYERFFRMALEAGRHRVKCVTSPANALSVAFHHAMGFRLEGPAGTTEGLPVHPDYDGPGEDRVLLVKEL